MTTPELTLNEIKKTAKPVVRTVRVSDFLTSKQKANIYRAREEKAATAKIRGYDAVDAYSAEILGRFGYEAWQAWQCGQIPQEKMAKLILAERARDKQLLLGLEGLILAVGAGANRPTKSGHAPKSLKNAIKILKNEQKLAKGLK